MTRKLRKTRLYMSVAALLLPVVGIGIWELVPIRSSADDGISLLMRGSGYYELQPPSRLGGPGTINTVETLSDGSLRLHPTCTMDKNALAALWQESVTVDRHLVSNVTNAFDAMADALSVFAAHTTGNRVKKISISFENMRIVTISDESLFTLRDNYLKGSCEEAVAWNLKNQAKVCQTEEVLEADLAYRMSFADGIGIAEKAEIAKQFAGSAKLDVNSTNEDEMRGTGLYFGVRVGLKCFKLNDATKDVVVRL